MSLDVNIYKKLGSFCLDVQASFSDKPTAVIGASGSGKSMLLRCIAGIIVPDSGRIVSNQTVWYDSVSRTSISPQKRHAGYLFQHYALFENKTVAENIMIGMKGSKQQKKQLCDVFMRRFHLAELAKQYPSQLSGGQKQRTALARMLAAKPDVLLLDEPFSALDTHLRGQVCQQMADVLEQHTGVSLLVTHDFSEAMQLCPTAAVISDGKIVEYGNCQELWKHPKTLACAQLTGMRNFFPAENSYCLGIRPEDLRPAQRQDTIIFTGTVKHILPGIHTSQIVIDTVQGDILWNTSHIVKTGEQVILSADRNNIHMLKK